MKKYQISIFNLTMVLLGLMLTEGCTKLNETLYGSNSAASSGVQSVTLQTVYKNLANFLPQDNMYALMEHPTDEMMGPTRGTDWDDNGTWRELHLHTWTSNHTKIIRTWTNLGTYMYNATYVSENSAAGTQQKAEALFLKAFFQFYWVDFFGQLPYRPSSAGALYTPTVSTRSQATDTLINDLTAALPNLPSTSGLGQKTTAATQDAASFLLAKVYLNKAVYKQDPTNPAGFSQSTSFLSTDMDNVIKYCNNIISSGHYMLNSVYWDNFSWKNNGSSSESIFALSNNTVDGIVGSVQPMTRMGFHYLQNPSGWNGFTTLSAFYNSFSTGDQRLGGPSANVTGYTSPYTINGATVYLDSAGRQLGFLKGQQYIINTIASARAGVAPSLVYDRSGSPLVFTSNVDLFYSTEAQGIRVHKYLINPSKDDAATSINDYVFFRYADVLLMKAEAIQRGGTDPLGATALGLINQLRTARGASTLTSLTLSDILAERGRELYYEAWRRQDLIRFGTFNAAVDQRSSVSGGYRVVFPIPAIAVASNPNLKQNYGY